jgi:O-antigen/teichoic acid export membrane protein
MVFATVAGTLLSFRMHPYRPKIAFSKIREIWSFAQWMLLWRLAFFLNQKIDQFLVGGTYGTSSMGRYYMAAEVATIPTFELVLPLGRGLFPNYAKLIGDPERFASALLRSFGLVAILCAPMGFGLSAVAESAVIVVLGEKWRPIIPLLEWFAVFGVAAALSHLAAIVLFVAGREQFSAMGAWLQVIALCAILGFGASIWQLEQIATVRTAIAIAFTPIMIGLIRFAAPLGLWRLCGVLWRPLVAAAAMAVAIRALELGALVEGPPAVLALEILLGAGMYGGALLSLWLITGRPDGAETAILSAARSVLRDRLNSRSRKARD